MQVSPEATLDAPRRVRWWREVLYVGLFYAIYSVIRNRFGSATVGPAHAFNNALRVIRWERAVGLFHEESIQEWLLPYKHVIRFWNVYYGTFHFIVTGAAMIWCYHRRSHIYPLARNTLAATTALALIGFATFPLMPPRLLDATSAYGGAFLHKKSFGFVDTLSHYGGLWSFDSGTMKALSNQYAAMPSLHCAWATWCAFVMWRLCDRRWERVLLVAYPFLTLFCIIVTANHYWIDGIGGLVVLAGGFVVGQAITRSWDKHHERRITTGTAD